MKIAFLGLGTMGSPMARHLAAAGHSLTVYNRTRSRADAWVAANGGRLASTPAEAAHGQDVVMTCVGSDDDLRHVLLGADGALKGMKRGALLADHTTASRQIAIELSRAAGDGGVLFVDAPVSGGQVGAEAGTLTVMCGGSAAAFAVAEPVLSCFARSVRHMGPVGHGQLAKMANQICSAGIVQSLAEGIRFAQSAGLDVALLLEVMSQGAATSWHMANRGITMSEGRFEFGFAIDWVRKDLQLCLAEANRLGSSLPVTAIVDQFCADIQRAGGGRLDMSSLITRL